MLWTDPQYSLREAMNQFRMPDLKKIIANDDNPHRGARACATCTKWKSGKHYETLGICQHGSAMRVFFRTIVSDFRDYHEWCPHWVPDMSKM